MTGRAWATPWFDKLTTRVAYGPWVNLLPKDARVRNSLCLAPSGYLSDVDAFAGMSVAQMSV